MHVSTGVLTRLLFALTIGVFHVVFILGVIRHVGYSVPSGWTLSALLGYTGIVSLGTVPVLLAVCQHLIIPIVLSVVATGLVVSAELTLPRPEFEQRGEATIVHHGLYVSKYLGTWYFWTAVYVSAGVAEYAARSYLSVLPTPNRPLVGLWLPVEGRTVALLALAAGGLNVAVMVGFAFQEGFAGPDWMVVWGGIGMGLLGAIPVALLVHYRLLVPFVVFVILTVNAVYRQLYRVGPSDPFAFYFVTWFVWLGVVLISAASEYGLRIADLL